jgi:hypothetical protein
MIYKVTKGVQYRIAVTVIWPDSEDDQGSVVKLDLTERYLEWSSKPH